MLPFQGLNPGHFIIADHFFTLLSQFWGLFIDFIDIAHFFIKLIVIAWALPFVMSGRAAYLHVGVVLGTLMAANVWMRIIPPQREMVDAMKTGGTPNRASAVQANGIFQTCALKTDGSAFCRIPRPDIDANAVCLTDQKSSCDACSARRSNCLHALRLI